MRKELTKVLNIHGLIGIKENTNIVVGVLYITVQQPSAVTASEEYNIATLQKVPYHKCWHWHVFVVASELSPNVLFG